MMLHAILQTTLAALVLAGGAALAAPPAKTPAAPGPVPPLVDINRAGIAELKTLPGIGDAEAARIVARRPYLTKADLVLNRALPEGVYLQIKGRIVAKPLGKPRA